MNEQIEEFSLLLVESLHSRMFLVNPANRILAFAQGNKHDILSHMSDCCPPQSVLPRNLQSTSLLGSFSHQQSQAVLD